MVAVPNYTNPHYTTDGVQVVCGLEVWTTDYIRGTVWEPASGWDGWWYVLFPDGRRRLYDGTRMSVRGPRGLI